MSDTHNTTPGLPPGDPLIHAGDLTQNGSVEELQNQVDWLNKQPLTYKVIIAGNHDVVVDKQKCRDNLRRSSIIRWESVVYLELSGTTLTYPNGVRESLFGHPDTRRQGRERHRRVFALRAKHRRDLVRRENESNLRGVWRVKPRLHVFGHVHEAAGRQILLYSWGAV